MGKKTITIILIGAMIFSIIGCHTQDDMPQPPGKGNTADKKGRGGQLGFKDSDVEGVKVSSRGDIYSLSEGSLYVMEERNWKRIDFDRTITAYYLLEGTEGVTVVAGTDKGSVHILPDGSDRWIEGSAKTLEDAIDFITGSTDKSELWMGQSAKEGGGLWKSSDGGITWDKMTDITVRGIAVHPEQREVIYIVDKLTYMSRDGGVNWTKLDTGANYGVLIHPLRPEIAYLAYARGVVPADHQGRIGPKQEFRLPGGITRLEFNPSNPDEWALGMWDYPSGTGGLYYTFDGGKKWIEVEQMADARIIDLNYSSDGKKLYVAASGKGLWMVDVETLVPPER
ncbi:MAG: hypothetical protein HPY66_0520 [Firmicutes bacterium]|nr:hypothetical protein [Bacillota bacterium]